jgi:hypothetical protein
MKRAMSAIAVPGKCVKKAHPHQPRLRISPVRFSWRISITLLLGAFGK